MRCEICHTDHAPHQAHVFPSQRTGTAPHAGLHARTCAECATLRAKIVELRAENDGLRAALDMAMESNAQSNSGPPVRQKSNAAKSNKSNDGFDKKAYQREYMAARRAAKKTG